MIFAEARRSASELGLTRFDPGEACRKGHWAERYVLSGACVVCAAANRIKHRKSDPKLVREKRAAYRNQRREIEREQDRARRKKNPEAARARVRKWRERNHGAEVDYQKKKWIATKDKQLARKRERYKTDPLFALKTTVRNRIGEVIRKGGFTKRARAAVLLGCTWEELRTHIEKQFKKGMTWDNRGKLWHVDHIVPLAEAKTSEDVSALCHFTNLRPLWGNENARKGARRVHLI